MFTDANTEFEPDAIRALVAHFSDPRVGAVSGELRLHDRRPGDNRTVATGASRPCSSAASRVVGGLLGANGGIYAIRRALYRPLPRRHHRRRLHDRDGLSRAWLAHGVRARGVAFERRPPGIDDEFRRRVRIGIGNYQAFFRHPEYWCAPTWRRRFTYLSHKVLRWFTPHLLLRGADRELALAAGSRCTGAAGAAARRPTRLLRCALLLRPACHAAAPASNAAAVRFALNVGLPGRLLALRRGRFRRALAAGRNAHEPGIRKARKALRTAWMNYALRGRRRQRQSCAARARLPHRRSVEHGIASSSVCGSSAPTRSSRAISRDAAARCSRSAAAKGTRA